MRLPTALRDPLACSGLLSGPERGTLAVWGCQRGPAAAPRVPACNVAAATPPLAIQVGRANYTTSERLLRTGALTQQTLAMLQSYFRPHNDALHAMFPHSQFW